MEASPLAVHSWAQMAPLVSLLGADQVPDQALSERSEPVLSLSAEALVARSRPSLQARGAGSSTCW